MLDGGGDALYVGKARDLKKRVTPTPWSDAWTNGCGDGERDRRHEVITTHTEAEALLLEAN